MSSKKRQRSSSRMAAPSASTTRPAATTRPTAGRSGERPTAGLPTGLRARIGLLVAALALLGVFVVGAAIVMSSGATSPTPAGSNQFGVVVPGNGGHWTNVTPDQLSQMLGHKDFTLVNVKTPYIGEIAGTDSYIPYNQLTARASELPADKAAKVLVYCKTGITSKIAAQTLLDLGYTNIWNLDGGMDAWQASGRALVNLNR